MKILDRWILKRFALAYVSFTTTVLVMFVMTDGFNHLDQFYAAAKAANRPLLAVVAENYVALVPDIYYLLAPFVTLVAAMWVIFELRRQNEFVPLQAAGVAPWRMTFPLFFAAFVLALVMYADKELVIPRFVEQRRGSTNLKRTHVLLNPIPDRSNSVLSARFYLPHERALGEPRYTRFDERLGEAVCAVASTAVYSEKGEGWIFKEGFRFRRGSPDDVYEPIGADGLLIKTDVRPQDVESATVEMLGYLTSKQLWDQYQRIPAFKHIYVEICRRTAYPCASLVLLLLGIPFVLRGDPGDKSAAALGLLACIGMCALFFLVTAFFEDMGNRPGGIPPPLAAWLANLVFVGPGLVAFLRSTR
jgi:lipopolysaccharide export LptBFGC system permease protein LptF